MSHDDPFIGQLEDYLEEFDGATPLPERVRDAIRGELPSVRQVRPTSGPRKIFTTLSTGPTGARLGLATAAVALVALVLSVAWVNNSRSELGVGAGATPTPAPTPALMLAQASPAPCDTSDTAKSCLPAGTFQLTGSAGEWPVTVTFDVPAGWFEWQAAPGFDGVLVDGGAANRTNSGWGAMFATVGDVSRDACDPTKGLIPAAQVDTPAKLAAAMAAWPGFTATTPQPITVDGHSGLKLQLTITDPSACSSSPPLWLTTFGGTVNGYPMVGNSTSAPGTYAIVDTGHGLLVIRTTDFPETSPNEIAAGIASNPTAHAADQVALHAILNSIRLSEPPASS